MVQSGAFEKMPKQGSISAEELGALVNIEPNVIGLYSICSSRLVWAPELTVPAVRLMRMLTGTGVVELTGDDTYAHTPKSLAYLQGAGADFWNLW